MHTPGPWHYRPDEHDDWGIVRASNEVGRFLGPIICQARDPDASDEITLSRHCEAKTDPWEANARLIASAPDLLEALRKAAKWFRDYERQHRAKLTGEGNLKADTNAERAAFLEAAILKATQSKLEDDRHD